MAPGRVLQRRGHDVFRSVVHEWRAGILRGSTGRPGWLEHLIGFASKQDRLAATHELADRLRHARVEAVLGRPRRRIDHPVETGELMAPDRSHVYLHAVTFEYIVRLLERCHPRYPGGTMRITDLSIT